MSLQRWILLALICAAVFAAVVAAQDDDKSVGQAGEGQVIEEVAEGVDAEDAADDLEDDMDAKDDSDSMGLRASHYLPKYADLKVPAGERVEILVPISNAVGNPAYEVALVAGHLATIDHQRFIQNFSAQVYDRKVEAGETATIKYTVTPDALIEPSEYAFVVAAYLRTDDNQTLSITAFNGTMSVVDASGYDVKGNLSLVVFFGVIGAVVWFFFFNGPAAAAPKKTSVAAAVATEAGTQAPKGAYDPDFVDPAHLAFLKSNKGGRGRSASPKK